MSTFLYAVIAIGLVIVKYFMEQKSKTADTTATDETLTEVFPTTSYDHENEEDDEEDWIAPHSALNIQDEQIEEISGATEKSEADDKIDSPMIQEANNDSTSSPERVTLSTREEARRAFIYSEIFNRKYE